MNYRELGATGLRVSEIGFGGWGIGGPAEGAPAYGTTDDRESKQALIRAYDLGINFFDTSDLYGYGHSERLIGEALKNVRPEVIIASKVGFLDGNGAQNFTEAHLKRSLDASLKRLGTDYIDLYQLHSPSIADFEQIEQMISLFLDLKRDGKIRAIGVSVRSPDDGFRIIDECDVQCIQVNFNLVDQRALGNGLFDVCQRRQIGTIVRTPLCFGLLTGAYSPASNFDSGDHRSNWSHEQISRWANAIHLFAEVAAEQKGQTHAQTALRFCLSYSSVSTVIPGMLTAAEVEENSQTSGLGSFSQLELQELEHIYQGNSFFVGG